MAEAAPARGAFGRRAVPVADGGGGGFPGDRHPAPPSLARRRNWRRDLTEGGIGGALVLCAGVSVVTTFLIIYVLISEALTFFQEVSLVDFLFGTRWAPLLDPRSFGVLPLVAGTMMIVAWARAWSRYRSVSRVAST